MADKQKKPAVVDFKNYINKSGFKVDEIERTHYQFIPGNVDSGWKLHVPEEKKEEFFQNYYNKRVKHGLPCSLGEKPHPKYNQIRIDIDLKYLIKDVKTDTLNHIYNIETIKKLLIRKVLIISEYIEIPIKGINFTIFEKKHPTLDGGIKSKSKYIKDGIHILCPDIVLDNNILHAIYADFIADEETIKISKDLGSDEDISKIFDKCVIDKVLWMLYGSGKPKYEPENYYKDTVTFNFKYNPDNGKVSVKDIDLGLSEYQKIVYFSNFNKTPNCKIHENIDIEQIKLRLNNSKSKKTELSAIDRLQLFNNKPSKTSSKVVDFALIKHLLKCLSKERYSNYDEWFKVGVCLYNICDYLLSAFIEWSSQWEHFSKSDVEHEWYNKIRKYGEGYALSLEQLKRMAKDDNPKMYYKLMNAKRQTFLMKIIEKISSQLTYDGKKQLKKVIGPLDLSKYISQYINELCQWQIKCADNTSSTWYIFKNGLWQEDKGAHSIHSLISEELIPSFRNTAKAIQQEMITLQISGSNNMITNNLATTQSSDMELSNNFDVISLSSNDNRGQDLLQSNLKIELNKHQIATIVSLNDYLQKTINRSNLIKDMSQQCYDKDFYTYLNENRNIFVCGNCTLDLVNLEIREGLPEDMSTIKSHIDYPINCDDEESMELMTVVQDLLDKIFPIFECQEHSLNVFAESLSGIQRREKFIIHTGSGGNGKSVIFDLLHIVFGEYSYSPDATIFSFHNDNPNTANPVIAGVKGKRLIDTGEPDAAKPFNVAGIKKMTGGDSLTGRHLHKELISFKPQGTFHICTNDIPKIDGPADGGIERRMEVHQYPSRFVSPNDKKLKNPEKYPYHYPRDEKFRNPEYLTKLAPYLLKLLFERYCRLYKSKFVELLDEANIPKQIRQFTEDYIKSSNAIDLFIDEHIEEREGYRQKFTEIYHEFKRFSTESHIKVFPKDKFLTQFERRLGIKIKGGRTKYSYGFVTVNNGEEAEDE